MRLWQHIRHKAKEVRGEFLPKVSFWLIAFSLFLSVMIQLAMVWFTCIAVQQKTDDAVRAACAENVANIYNGVRESDGQARQVAEEGDNWHYIVNTAAVVNVMTKNMGYSRNGDSLYKYGESNQFVYALHNFYVQQDNPESGLNFITTFQVEIPLWLGNDMLPPLTLNMRVRSTYDAKFDRNFDAL